MTRAHAAAAAKAFEETLEELDLPDSTPELRDPKSLGRRAALLAVAEAGWAPHLGPSFPPQPLHRLPALPPLLRRSPRPVAACAIALRSAVSLTPADLSGFPRLRLERGVTLFRIHKVRPDPWWFSNNGGGRFDLTVGAGAPGDAGTCYFGR